MLPSYPFRFLHLVALWSYAVSQPVFSMLHGNPEFLVIRGSTRIEMVIFALSLALVPPLLAVLSEWVVSRLSSWVADALHLMFVGVFVTPLALFVLKQIGPGEAASIVAASIVAAAAVALYGFKVVQSFLTLSLILPAAGLVLFMTSTPLVVDDVAGAKVPAGKDAPVVVLVLDELPASSLMTPAGNIDSARYPSFGRLARDSTWYPRTTTVHEHTVGAVPAILTGRLPRGPELPTLSDHPENLFTLLGEGYGLHAHETATYLCPARYCPRDREPLRGRLEGLFADVRVAYLHRVLPDSMAAGLPEVGDRWTGLNRDWLLVAEEVPDIDAALSARSLDHEQQLDLFISGISAAAGAARVHFAHLILPHSPWRFMPSGQQYPGEYSVEGRDRSGVWTTQEWPVLHAHQRHLLQVMYTDRLLGKLLRRLHETGLYDRALIVVVADHGAGFVPGESARKVTAENVADIARVPLIVKLPGQRSPRIDLRPARTIDILPTIADVLEVRIPWKVHGRSLFGPADPTQVEIAIRKRDGGQVKSSLRAVDRAAAETIKHQASVFGTGRSSLFVLGSTRELIGLQVRALSVARSNHGRARLDDPESFEDVDVSVFVPARIVGDITGVDLQPGREVAIALNGRIAALGKTYELYGRQRFSAVVPPTTFRDGFNRVEVFLVEGGGSTTQLIRLGASEEGLR